MQEIDEDFHLNTEYTVTKLGEPFLLEKDGQEPLILVFATKQFIKLLAESTVLFADGTFFTAPQHFTQLFTIHTLYNNQMILLSYALLPNKEKRSYLRVFQILQAALMSNNLQFNQNMRFQTDFERSSIEAIKVFFPTSQPKGKTLSSITVRPRFC